VTLVGLRLASAGYGGGDPEVVVQMRADWVVKMLQYEVFKSTYQEVFVEMNKGGA